MGLVRYRHFQVARVSDEGKEYINQRLSRRSDKGVDLYSKFIEYKLSCCIRNGEFLGDYFPMSKEYKEIKFKSFKNDFGNFLDEVFIVYRRGTVKGSYVTGYKCKYYRLNTSWVKKYVSIESKKARIKQKKKNSIPILEIEETLKLSLSKVNPVTISMTKDEKSKKIYSFARMDIRQRYSVVNGNTCRYTDDEGITREVILHANESSFARICSNYYGCYINERFNNYQGSPFNVYRNRHEKRLYHKLIFFPKRLYKYMRFSGRRIAEIDLSNCFPRLIIQSLLDSQSQANHVLKGNQMAIDFISRSNVYDTSENRLVESVKHGNFYDIILRGVYPNRNEDFYTKRRDFIKTKCSEVLFGKWSKMSDFKTRMEEEFPLFMDVIIEYKKNIINSLKENPDSSLSKYLTKNGEKSSFKAGNDSLAIFGMVKESRLFIEQVLPRLYERHLYAIPKHDAILCLETELADVKEVISMSLDIVFGAGEYQVKTKIYKD